MSDKGQRRNPGPDVHSKERDALANQLPASSGGRQSDGGGVPGVPGRNSHPHSAFATGRPPHPHSVPSMPPPPPSTSGAGLPPPPYHHYPPGVPVGHHHHPALSSIGASAGPPSSFFHPSAFNSGLAAAIAAAEYQRQREASATAHIFAAAHANGMQPFLVGFANNYGHLPPPSHPALSYQHQQQQQQQQQRPPQSASPAPQPPSPGSSHPTESPSPPTTPNPTGMHGGVIAPRMPLFSNGRPELPPPMWYDSSVPLGVDEDKYYLSELQCVLRSDFVEAFGTTQTDIVLPVHGRNKPIALGQVGIRCQHCRKFSSVLNNIDPADKNRNSTQNAISYPSFISGIYNTVQQMYRLHFEQCPYVPSELKSRVSTMKDSHASNRGGRKQYWIDSAKRIGLVDTSFGIHYGRDPKEPLPPLVSEGGGGLSRRSTSEMEENHDELDMENANEWERSMSYGDDPLDGCENGSNVLDDVAAYPLVTPEEKHLVTDYLYLALEQMQPCKLQDADRVGCYKGRRTGFPGLACKHCIGQAGCGRYFPASEASLSQTTTSQTIVNHVRNCRRCPLEVREQLELMKRAKTCPDYKKTDKPKHGGRKVFFRRLWCRIQRIPLPRNDSPSSPPTVHDCESPKKDSPPPSPSLSNMELTAAFPRETPEGEKKRRRTSDSTDDECRKIVKRSLETEKYDNVSFKPDAESDGGSGGVVEMVEFDNVHEEGDVTSHQERGDFSSSNAANSAKNNAHIAYQGRARLTRGDDLHWLSESDCFIRQELAEVFTAQEEDLGLFGDPQIGQVGVRCFYCAQNLPSEERGRGHVYYPSSVAAVQQAVSDLQRRHFGICTEIPEQVRKTFHSMKGYGAKPKGDTTQYWTDAAKELGLHDFQEGDGIFFFRNPLNNSPADDIDIEKNDDSFRGSILVPAVDRFKCTDHTLLLLKQFQPCQFHASNRKSSRSRDRSIGFPGLVCVNCMQKKYFPINEKKLQDSLCLMATHILNCFRAPLEVKASLCYLQHRSLVQRQELAGQWKFTFFKGVWNRLHRGFYKTESTVAINVDATSIAPNCNPVNGGSREAYVFLGGKESLTAEDDGHLLEEETDVRGSLYPEKHNVKKDNYDELKEMKDLIKSAALWLSERDADNEAHAHARSLGGGSVGGNCGGGGGRGRGTKRK